MPTQPESKAMTQSSPKRRKTDAPAQDGGLSLCGVTLQPGQLNDVKLAIASPFKSKSNSPAMSSVPHSSPKVQALNSTWDSSNWDLDTQQPHGGQEWSTIPNFVEDFTVTTNFLGPPRKALMACGVAIQDIEHYPPANFEPYLSELAEWIQPNDAKELAPRLMLGNGASELIDLVTRIGAHKGAFSARSEAQYREYERAALADGRKKVIAGSTDAFSMLAIVNPCNPTGEYLHVEEMKQYIETACKPHTTVVVDESMQLWHGPEWRNDALVSQRDWIKKMFDEKDISIYVIHSWTKIWTCPGIRLGSIIGPTPNHISELKKHQVPWSLNVFALKFLSACVKDADFLRDTWQQCKRLRARTISELLKMFPNWEIFGEEWLSWLWIDTKSEKMAANAVRVAKAAGTPIRNGAMGYNCPTFVRFKVTSEQHQEVLFAALRTLVPKK